METNQATTYTFFRGTSNRIFLLKENLDFLLTICLILMGVLIFYPGAMSGDSVDQWRQVNTPDQIGNWFPPTMVYLWMILNKITHGPQGMLIFHYGIYYLSIYIFGKVMIKKPIYRLFFILAIGLFPPLFFLTGVIWKDTSLLIAISMSTSLLFLFETTRNKFILVCSLLFFLYGISTRHNGLVCTIPYSCYLVFIMRRNNCNKQQFFTSVCVLVFCFSAASIFLTNYKIKDIWKTYNFENAVFLWDLWGMSIEIGENIIPPYVFNENSRNLEVSVLKKYYSNQSNSIIYLMQFLTTKRFKGDFPNARFKRDFIKAIATYPLAYLKVRGRLTLFMLGYKPPIDPFVFTPPKFDRNHYLFKYSQELDFNNTKLLNSTAGFANLLFHSTPLWRVWLYIVLGILQIIIILVSKPTTPQKRRLLLILSTGLIYWLPYPIISPAIDFRFSNLTIFYSILALPFSAKIFCSLFATSRVVLYFSPVFTTKDSNSTIISPWKRYISQ